MESTPGPATLSVSPRSLAAAFATVPDPRRTASVVYPLAAILAMAVAALLANHRSVLAIAEWGARQDPIMLAALGFPDGRTPVNRRCSACFGTSTGMLWRRRWRGGFGPQAAPAATAETGEGVAIDGKAQRGRLRFGTTGCPVHALSAFCHAQGIVLAHEPITSGTDQAEAELTVAPALLARIDWRDRTVTGDALFCQRALCQQVQQAGGDYLFRVKENQPQLHADIALLFDPPATLPATPLSDRRAARTVETGHGRQQERRELVASTDLTAYLDWPGVRQVFRLEHTWRAQDQVKRTVRYGITSLAPDRADAARLLALRRGHWSIENQLHRHKDVNFGEDASLIHVGQGPTVMALLRDAALNLLHRAGCRRIASQLRTHSQQPERAVALVIGPLPTRA